jgi:hypothetical protein
MFLDCPAYMDHQGGTRCGLPAEIEHRYSVRSTDGDLDSAKIRCPRGHWFNGPLESLTWGQPSVSGPDQARPGARRAFAAVAEGLAPRRTRDFRG